jgi:hypothetical protein
MTMLLIFELNSADVFCSFERSNMNVTLIAALCTSAVAAGKESVLRLYCIFHFIHPSLLLNPLAFIDKRNILTFSLGSRLRRIDHRQASLQSAAVLCDCVHNNVELPRAI